MVQGPKGRQLVGCGLRLLLILFLLLLVAAAAAAAAVFQVLLLAYYVIEGANRTRFTAHAHRSTGSTVETLLVPAVATGSAGIYYVCWWWTSLLYGVTTTDGGGAGGCDGGVTGDNGWLLTTFVADWRFTFGRAHRSLRVSEEASLAAGSLLAPTES